MANITYTDKVDVSANALPQINKFTAANANEIKSAVNSKQDSDGDITAIAALSPSNDDLLQRKSGVWTNRTPAQVKTDLGVLTSLPQNWSFPAGAFPTTAGIIYIATADSGVIGDANYVAIGTWMIANTLTPSTYSHFIYK